MNKYKKAGNAPVLERRGNRGGHQQEERRLAQMSSG
jgi:hypothetical protein